MDAQWLGSPNFTAGRDGQTMRFGSPLDPSYVVLHTTAGTIEDANARFQQSAQQASAHYGIGLSGRLVQWVREEDAAWHAGNWLMNLKSIGIEHEDAGDYNGPRSPQLYATSAALVRDICARYGIPITREWIRMHREVSDSLTTCPDALDVDRIVREAAAQPLPGPTPMPVPPTDDSLTRDRPIAIRTSDAEAAPKPPPPSPAPPTPVLGSAPRGAPLPIPSPPVVQPTAGLPAAEPGYTTTEFWGKSAVEVFSVVFGIYVAAHPTSMTPAQKTEVVALSAVIIPAVLEALYGFYRSWRKRGTPG